MNRRSWLSSAAAFCSGLMFWRPKPAKSQQAIGYSKELFAVFLDGSIVGVADHQLTPDEVRLLYERGPSVLDAMRAN